MTSGSASRLKSSSGILQPGQDFRFHINCVGSHCFPQVTEFDPKNSRDRFYTLSIDQEKRRGPYRTMAQVTSIGCLVPFIEVWRMPMNGFSAPVEDNAFRSCSDCVVVTVTPRNWLGMTGASGSDTE